MVAFSVDLFHYVFETASPIEVFLLLYVILKARNLERRVTTLEQYIIERDATKPKQDGDE